MIKDKMRRTLVRYPPMTGPNPKLNPFNMVNKVLFLEFSLRETLSARTSRVLTASPENPSPWKPRPSSSIGQFCAPAPRTLPMRMKKMAA